GRRCTTTSGAGATPPPVPTVSSERISTRMAVLSMLHRRRGSGVAPHRRGVPAPEREARLAHARREPRRRRRARARRGRAGDGARPRRPRRRELGRAPPALAEAVTAPCPGARPRARRPVIL